MSANKVIDLVKDKTGVVSDAALCRLLDVKPSFISKIRHEHIPLGATMLVKLNEVSGIPIRDMKQALGLPCLTPHSYH